LSSGGSRVQYTPNLGNCNGVETAAFFNHTPVLTMVIVTSQIPCRKPSALANGGCHVLVFMIVRAVTHSTVSIVRRYISCAGWRHEHTMNALVAKLRHMFIHQTKSARDVAVTATQRGANSNELTGPMPSKPDVPEDVRVKPAPLSREQRRWLDDALALVDEERMRT